MNKSKVITARFIPFIFATFLITFHANGQVDTVNTKKDVTIEKVDPDDQETKKKHRKKKNEFKVFAGVTFNDLVVDNDKMGSSIIPGFMLGAAYKQGRFFFWQLGVRYNNAVYDLKDKVNPPDSTLNEDGIFGVRRIDIPVKAGINFLSFTDRLVGLRVFAGAVPSFLLDVGDNNLPLTKDDANSFLLLGEVGVEVDIAFFIIAVGYNYGFTDFIRDDVRSNPQQLFVNLGLRF